MTKIFPAPLALIVGLSLATLPASAQKPTDGRRFAESTSVVVVEVPVNVLDDGKPVRGLTAADFRVFDGKKEQELVGFEVVDLEALESQANPATVVPTPARRRFLLFFDFAFTRRNELTRSIAGARQLVSGLHPSDVVALASFSRSRGAELLVNFTNDRRQVNSVLDGLDQILAGKIPPPAQAGAAGRDPLRLVVDREAEGALDISAVNIAADALGEADGSGRAGAIQAETLADMAAATGVRMTDRVRSLFKEMAGTLGDFAAATAGLDGRRFFVFFTHGFDSSIFVDGNAGLNAQGISRGGTSARNSLDQAVDQFRKAGWEIHTVDPVNANDRDQFSQVDMLVSMAKETGGAMYRNFGNLGVAMGSMLERTAVTYVLAFQIENVRQDGDYHPIKVELKPREGLRGAKVFHRAGYTAQKPDAQGIARAVTTAEKILSDDVGGDLELNGLFVPFRGPAGMTRVASFLTTPGADLLAGLKGTANENLSVEIYAYAVAPNGDIHDFLAQQVTLEAAKARERLTAGTFGMFFDLNLPPGDYDLRMLIRQGGGPTPGQNAPGQRYRLEGRKLRVPDLSGSPRLGGLALFDDVGGALVIREKAANAAVPYPFVLGDSQEFLPLTPVKVDATATTPRRLCLFGYGLREPGLALNFSLRDAGGNPLADRLRIVGAAPSQPNGLDRVYLELDTANLPAGDYQVVAALDQPGTQEEVVLDVQLR